MKVINIYYEKPNGKNPYLNGLIFELEDGTLLHQNCCENQCLVPFDVEKREANQ